MYQQVGPQWFTLEVRSMGLKDAKARRVEVSELERSNMLDKQGGAINGLVVAVERPS